MANFFHVSVEALLGYDVVAPGGITALSDDSDSAFLYVPVFGRVSAGYPLDWDEVDSHFPIPNEVMRKHGHAFLLRVVGTSMDRVLPDGCLALVDPDQREPLDLKIYAVCVNGYAATIKRIHILANGFELVPDSNDPTYKPTVYDFGEPDTETVTVIGRVVWYTLPFDFDL